VNAVQIITWVGYAVALYWSVRFFVWSTFERRGIRRKVEPVHVIGHTCPAKFTVRVLTLHKKPCAAWCTLCDRVTYNPTFLNAGNSAEDIARARVRADNPTQGEMLNAQEDPDPAPVRDRCGRCDDDARHGDGGRNCPDHLIAEYRIIGDANRTAVPTF
jgi:hypothetical protein